MLTYFDPENTIRYGFSKNAPLPEKKSCFNFFPDNTIDWIDHE